MDTIKEQNAPLVEEGLQYLNQAMANRANYDDAMSYLNLIYRRKADVDYGNAEAVKAGRCGGEGVELQGHGNPQGERSQEG